MSAEAQTSGARQGSLASRFITTFGCLGGAVGFGLFILYFAASCTDAPAADGRIALNDTAGLLSPLTRARISAARFPAGIPVVVRTVDSIPKQLIGSFATDLMEEETAWQGLRPRNWLRTYFRQDPPWAPGVYVLVSRHPELMQIRFGHAIRLAAYQEQLAVGPWYLAMQKYDTASLSRHLDSTLTDLAGRMKRISDPWWLLRWARWAASWVTSELEDWLAPSDGLYSRRVLPTYISVAASVGATRGLWTFVWFNAVLFVVLGLLVKTLLIEKLLLHRVRHTWMKVCLGLIAGCGLLGVLLTGLAAMALLSHGRIEDGLALEAMGLPFAWAESLDPGRFASRGGLVLAIPGCLLALIHEGVESYQAMQADAQEGTSSLHLPVKWLGWGCALFLMPLPIAAVAFVLLISSATVSLITVTREA